MSVPQLDELRHEGHVPHQLHQLEQTWPETNCYVDLWIELLHAIGLDPVAGLAFTLSADFDGEQWDFFKYPPEDLRALYGIDVDEINVWRPLEDHIVAHFDLGHVLTVEVDSWYLPDTVGVAYRTAHQKTTIVPISIDRDARRLAYFHNGTVGELADDDYCGALRTDAAPESLVPYVERVDFAGLVHHDDLPLRQIAEHLAIEHLDRRPTTNPVERLADRVRADLPTLSGLGPELFHAYAFGTLRQCGAWAQTAAAFTAWWDDVALAEATDAFIELAGSAKSCQFKLARIAAGRSSDLDPSFALMAEHWGRAYDSLAKVHGG